LNMLIISQNNIELQFSPNDFQGIKQKVELFQFDWDDFDVISDSENGIFINLHNDKKEIPVHFLLILTPIKNEKNKNKFLGFLHSNVCSFNSLSSLLPFNDPPTVYGLLNELIEENFDDFSVIPQYFYSNSQPKEMDFSFPVIASTGSNVLRCGSISVLSDFIGNSSDNNYLWIKEVPEGELILLKKIGTVCYSLEKGKIKELQNKDKYYRLLIECANQLQLELLTIELVRTKSGYHHLTNIIPYIIPGLTKQEQLTLKSQTREKIITLLKSNLSKKIRTPITKKTEDILQHPLVLFQTFLIITLISILYAMHQTSLLPRDSYNNIIPPFSNAPQF